MKFLTENDLRDSYKNEPFTALNLEIGFKLTPGARQFLLDRKIKILDHQSGNQKQTPITLQRTNLRDGNNWKDIKLMSKLKSVEALFLLTGEELLRKDVCLGEKTILLSKQFSQLKRAVKGECTVGSLTCMSCTKINEENFSHSLEDCFEITEFQIQLARGREILLLHQLRCALQELEPLVLELEGGSLKENQRYGDLICRVNQIINRLSQIICSLMGGKTCLIKQ